MLLRLLLAASLLAIASPALATPAGDAALYAILAEQFKQTADFAVQINTLKTTLDTANGTLQGLEPAFTTMGAAAADGLNMILRNIGPITTAAQWLAGIIGTLLLPVIISAGVQGTIAWAKQTAAAVTSAAIVSASCSTTMTVLPRSRNRSNVWSSRRLSR